MLFTKFYSKCFFQWATLLVLGLVSCESPKSQEADTAPPTFENHLQTVSTALKPYFEAKDYQTQRITNGKVFSKSGLVIETELPINELTFSPDNQLLASCGIGSEDHVQVWDLRTSELKSNAGKGFFHQPIFTPDNRFLLYTAVQNIEVWDISKQALVERFALSSKNIALSSEGFLVCEDSSLRVFRANIREGTASMILAKVDMIAGISFGSSHETLELLNRREAIVWENERMYRITHDLVQPITSRFSWRNQTAALINETGRSLTIKNEKDEVILVIKGTDFFGKRTKSQMTDQEQRMLEMMLSKGFYDAILFSPDGKYLTAIYHSFINRRSVYFLRIFDLKAQKLVYESGGNSLDINILAFSPDGKYLALGMGDNIKKGKGKIVVYDFETLLK